MSGSEKVLNLGEASSEPIGPALGRELVVAVVASVAAAAFWGVNEGFSILVGAGAYLMPYALAYAVFFGRLPGSAQAIAGALASRQKRRFAGGFLLAEFVKLALTLGILGATLRWYPQADWLVLLSAFGLAIVMNLVVLWWALKPAAN